jgi:hypothetical protein
VVLVGGAEPQDLATFSAGIGGTAIVQALAPLKRVIAPPQGAPAMKLEVRAAAGNGPLVLRQQR